MRPHRPDPASLPGRDLARLALAVDALTVGAPSPTLVHVDVKPDPVDDAAIVEVGLTPLPAASGLDDVIAALAGWRAPSTWQAVGVSTPAGLRTVGAGAADRVRPIRVVYLRNRCGERVTRLGVPDDPRLSGLTDGFPADCPLDRCLRAMLARRP